MMSAYLELSKKHCGSKFPLIKIIFYRTDSREGQFVQDYQKFQVGLEDPENETHKQ